MMYEIQFDELVDRRNSDSVKWRELEEFQGEKDVLPMWVADMDFKSSDEIIEALKTRVEHGVLATLYRWFFLWIHNKLDKNRYNWEIKKEWILFTPGVVMGLNIGVRELVEEGRKY